MRASGRRVLRTLGKDSGTSGTEVPSVSEAVEHPRPAYQPSSWSSTAVDREGGVVVAGVGGGQRGSAPAYVVGGRRVVDQSRLDLGQRNRTGQPHRGAVLSGLPGWPARRARRPPGRPGAAGSCGPSSRSRGAGGDDARGVLQLLEVALDVPLAQRGRHGVARPVRRPGRPRARPRSRVTWSRQVDPHLRGQLEAVGLRVRQRPARLVRREVSSTASRRRGSIMLIPIVGEVLRPGREHGDRRAAAADRLRLVEQPPGHLTAHPPLEPGRHAGAAGR